MINGTFVTSPSLTTLLRKEQLKTFQELNCVKIGTITAFDSAKRTASVKIAFRRRLVNGSIADYPELKMCPVVTIQGGGGYLSFPVKVGDECLVLFSDSNIDAWYESGGQSLPYDGRRHDISDGIVLVGLNNPATNSLSPAVTADEVSLDFGGSKIAEKNGKIHLGNATVNFLTAMDTFLTAMAGSSVLDAPTKAAATALKTQIDALFY